jgi:hypothetical protein
MSNRRVWIDIVSLLIHTATAFVAIIVGIVVSLILGMPILRLASRPFFQELAMLVVFFVFLGITGFSGFFINRWAGNRSACFVWAMGLLFLFAWATEGISGMKRSPYEQQLTGGQYVSYECYRLFGFGRTKWRRGGDGQGLEELIVSIPVLGSVVYSIGAWFALRSEPDRARRHNTSSPA